MRSLLAAVALLLLVLPQPSRAALLGDASVSYRALRTVTIDGRSYQGPVTAMPGHQRHDQDLFGMHEVFLLDTAKAQGVLVLPAVRTYLAFAFPPLMAELGAPDLTRRPVARETVAGVGATKYRVDHTAADGSRAEGFLWLAKGGILVKLDVAVTRAHGGRPMAVQMALSGLVVGPVDPALFVLPQGYTQLPADALGPLLGGKPPS